MNRKKVLITLGLLICILGVIGVSYAAWLLDFQQTKKNTVATSCFDVSLTSDTEGLDLQKAYPLLDEEGMELIPYTFTITNNCESYASYQVNLEVLNTSTLTDAGFIKVMFDENTPELLSTNVVVDPTLSDALTSYKLFTGYLDKKESVSHNVRIWLDENVDMEDALNNLTFKSKITVTASYTKIIPNSYEECVENYGSDSLQCGIIAQETSRDLCPQINTNGSIAIGGVNTTTAMLCGAPDDYGKSYYYRGPVENNWVKFGGYYWRILRINGDGSIRLLYNGDASVIDALDETTKNLVLSNTYDDSSTEYTIVGWSKYNYMWKKNNVDENSVMYEDNAAVGYMYGNRDGVVEESSPTYSSSVYSDNSIYVALTYNYIAETDSFVLVNPFLVSYQDLVNYIGYYTFNSKVDSFTLNKVYKIASVTLEETSTKFTAYITQYVSTSKDSAQTNTNDSDIKAFIDSWYETNLASYSSYINDSLFCNDRTFLEDNPLLGYGLNFTSYEKPIYLHGVTLKCSEQNDCFTVNDEVVGNGALTYPIALITLGETYAASGINFSDGSFTKSNLYYWTMTPDSTGYVKYVYSNGTVTSQAIESSSGVRPVINLKPNSLKSGDGSATNPFTVE